MLTSHIGIDFCHTRFDNGDYSSVHLGRRRLYCPQRSCQVNQTDKSRSSHSNPFLDQSEPHTFTKNKLYLSRNTSAEVSRTNIFWIRAVILRTYKAARLNPPSPSNQYGVRAIASTLVLHGNCSILIIVEYCFGRSQSSEITILTISLQMMLLEFINLGH